MKPLIFNQFTDPNKIRREINRSGGILNRKWVARHNGSFHDAQTRFEIVHAPGEILDFQELINAMQESISSDAQLIWESNTWI